MVNSLQAENSKIDSLKALVPDLEGTALANTYLDLGKEYMYISPGKSIEYANKALDIVAGSKQKSEICYANLLIGMGHIFTGDFNLGEKYINTGLKLAREINNPKYISLGLSSLAGYYMNTGNYKKALDLFNQNLQMAKKAGQKDQVAKAKFNIGSILTNKGDRAGGLRYMTEALKYFESTDNLTITARILNNIAVNYHSWKDYDLALKYYRKTLRLYERTGDIIGKAVVLNNIGEIYKDKGQYDMALKYYNQIFDVAKTHDVSRFYLAIGWVGLAETYQKKGDDSLAQDYARKALAEFKKSNMPEGQVHAKLVLAAVAMDNGSLQKAKDLVAVCIRESQKIGIKELTQNAFLLYSQVLEKQRDYRGALENYKQYIQITDSLDKEDETHQLALHRAELDLSEKESEIQLLQKDN
ncbi:MAG TPA: tetratricopeptide repeat protein, partial [Sunxiuqinia sp.]|nr:tetratricopeptide repeat protein [Sunxiuqinia sp.]